MPAKRWEVQQEGQALACECDSLMLASDCTASAVGMRGAQAAGEQMCPLWLGGEDVMLYDEGAFHRKDGRIINA